MPRTSDKSFKEIVVEAEGQLKAIGRRIANARYDNDNNGGYTKACEIEQAIGESLDSVILTVRTAFVD